MAYTIPLTHPYDANQQLRVTGFTKQYGMSELLTVPQRAPEDVRTITNPITTVKTTHCNTIILRLPGIATLGMLLA
jgi:hypothetical protein